MSTPLLPEVYSLEIKISYNIPSIYIKLHLITYLTVKNKGLSYLIGVEGLFPDSWLFKSHSTRLPIANQVDMERGSQFAQYSNKT